MSTRYPGAEWDPLGSQTASRMAAHDIVCLHTMAGSFTGTDSFFKANGYKGTESHFGLAGDGRLKQWQDLDYRADANNEGNDRIISIETADKGESFPEWSGSNVPPWTAAQLDEIVDLVRWLCDHYDIPKQLVRDSKPGRRGIAYHRQGIPGAFPPPYTGWVPGGELWTVLPGGRGKPCPGEHRITQLLNIVIPRVRGEDFVMDKTSADQVRAIVKSELAAARSGFGSTAAQLTHQRINDALDPEDGAGSVIRTQLLALGRRAVNESLGRAGDFSQGQLAERFNVFETAVLAGLDALREEIAETHPGPDPSPEPEG